MNRTFEQLYRNADVELMKYYGSPDDPSCAGDLAAIWSAVLSATIDFGHGGAFVVLRDEELINKKQTEDDYGIRCKYDISIELGKAFFRYVESSAELRRFQFDNQVMPSSTECLQVYHRLHNSCVNSEASLKDTIRTVAALSSTDGCVVLDRLLKVHGFGGEIRERKSDKMVLPLYRGITDNEIRPDEIEAYGMRHRSACRFTQRHSNVFVFVVSQDRDLSFFYSEPERAHRWEHLDADEFTTNID